MSDTSQPDAELIESLRDAGLIVDSADYERLTGGISSDIWKVTTPERRFCVKRALPQLAIIGGLIIRTRSLRPAFV